jgi:hypothetical protein
MSINDGTSRNATSDEKSLKLSSMSFLLEDVDRTAYDKALQYIQPLSELEDVFDQLPSTQAAMRETINRVNRAVTSSPDPILNALGLSNDQKELVDACTSAEVLKLSLLNAFDAIRQLLITDFVKTPKIYEDEAIELRIIPSSRTRNVADVGTPRRVPYSTVASMSDYAIYWQDGKNMVIGPDAGGSRLYDVSWRLPRTSATISMRNVPAGKIFLVARVEGDPAPVTPEKKRDILGIPLTPKGDLTRTLGDLSTDVSRRKTFDIEEVVRRNFRIPQPAVGFVESIYRAIRTRPPVQPPNLSSDDLARELAGVTLETFRNYFRELTQRTTTATGDITTYDIADTLFLGGLAWVGSLLGVSRTSAPPPPGPGSTAGSSTGSSAGAGGGSTGGGGSASRSAEIRHSLSNVLSDPLIAAGSTPAERQANINTLKRTLNQDELRKSLNRLTAGSVVFTEGTVDRWCELAGIREQK